MKNWQDVARKLMPDADTDYIVGMHNFPWKRFVFRVFLFALLVRLLIAGSYIHSFDTEWNIMWGVELAQLSRAQMFGFYKAYSYVSSLDYPPLYLYPLHIVGSLILKTDIGGYPPMRMLVLKFFPCLLDSLNCVVLYRLGSRRSRLIGLAGAALWAINPATIINCAFWGQTDCVLMLAAALLFLSLTEKRVVASGVLFAIMCSTKLQGLYLTPIVGMEILDICFDGINVRNFKRSSLDRTNILIFVRFVLSVLLTFTVIYLPFMVGSLFSFGNEAQSRWEKFFRPLTVYREGLKKYPYVTLNADNLYMLLNLNGKKDNLSFFHGLSYELMGKLCLIVLMLSVVVIYLLGRRCSHWLTAYFFINGIFMLTCRQHERYQIMILILLTGAFMELADRRMMTLLSLHTLVISVNQFRILASVRENSHWWWYYHASMHSIKQLTESDMEAVKENGAVWLRYNATIGRVNAAVNVCLLLASTVFVLRYFWDTQPLQPLLGRVDKLITDFRQRRRAEDE